MPSKSMTVQYTYALSLRTLAIVPGRPRRISQSFDYIPDIHEEAVYYSSVPQNL